MSSTTSTTHAFTLLELLVVIAIIGLLSSVVLAAVGDVREKARDARRFSGLKEIQQALELYYDDHGRYPGPTSQNGSWEISDEDGGMFIESLVSGGYLSAYVVDPINTGANRFYYYRYSAGNSGCSVENGAFYVLAAANIEGADESYTSLDHGISRTISAASPGWHCPENTGTVRDWQREFDWVTGRFEY